MAGLALRYANKAEDQFPKSSTAIMEMFFIAINMGDCNKVSYLQCISVRNINHPFF
jgi:hypothetical protein